MEKMNDKISLREGELLVPISLFDIHQILKNNLIKIYI